MQKIVEALAVKLSKVEQQDLRRDETRNLEAYESWLRARQLLGRGTRETIAQARALHRRAIELDPNFCSPHVGLAFAAVSDYVNAWIADPASALDEGERWARRAIELDERQPGGHVALGNVLVWRRRYDEALAHIHRAVELDTNYAQGHALLGMALMYSGHAAEALDALAASIRLDPHYPNIVLHLMAQAHFSLGHDEIAASHLLERIARNPNTDASRMLLAALSAISAASTRRARPGQGCARSIQTSRWRSAKACCRTRTAPISSASSTGWRRRVCPRLVKRAGRPAIR